MSHHRSLFRRHRTTRGEKAAIGLVGGLIGAVFYLIIFIIASPFYLIIFLIKLLFPSKPVLPQVCRICQGPFGREPHSWTIKGENVLLCTPCSSGLKKKKSNAALATAMGKNVALDIHLPPLPTSPPVTSDFPTFKTIAVVALLSAGLFFMFTMVLVIGLVAIGERAAGTTPKLSNPSHADSVSQKGPPVSVIPARKLVPLETATVPTSIVAQTQEPEGPLPPSYFSSTSYLPVTICVTKAVNLINDNGMSSLSPGDTLEVLSSAYETQYAVRFHSEIYNVDKSSVDHAVIVP